MILRSFKENDLEDLHNHFSQEGVGELAGWPHHDNINQSESVLEIFIKIKKSLAIEVRFDFR